MNITPRGSPPILHESEKVIFYTKDVYFLLVMNFFRRVEAPITEMTH